MSDDQRDPTEDWPEIEWGASVEFNEEGLEGVTVHTPSLDPTLPFDFDLSSITAAPGGEAGGVSSLGDDAAQQRFLAAVSGLEQALWALQPAAAPDEVKAAVLSTLWHANLVIKGENDWNDEIQDAYNGWEALTADAGSPDQFREAGQMVHSAGSSFAGQARGTWAGIDVVMRAVQGDIALQELASTASAACRSIRV